MQTVTHSDALSRFGCALSDPTRAEILLMLRDGPGYPSDLADKIGVSRQILSNHLACLRGCGLVVAEPEGRRSRLRTGRRADRARPRRPGRPGARRRPGLLPRRRDRRLLLMTAPVGDRGARRWPAASGCWSPRRSPTTSIEAVVALAEGTRVSSSALIGFGLDSVIEVSSAAAVAWQFSANGSRDAGEDGAAVHRVLVLRARRLCRRRRGACRCSAVGEAQPSPIGIVLAAAQPRRSCRCCRWRSAAPAANSDRCRPSPIPSRRCCAPICPRSCWRAWCSTACSAGRGPTRSPRSASPRWRSAKASTPGAATRAAQRTVQEGGIMPVVALVLFAVFAALGFGWRSWEQRRRTGSTGFRGVSGRPGSVGMVRRCRLRRRAGGRGRSRRSCSCSAWWRRLRVLHAPWIQVGGIAFALRRYRRDGLRAARHGRFVADRRRPGRDARRWSAPAYSAGCATRSSPR